MNGAMVGLGDQLSPPNFFKKNIIIYMDTNFSNFVYKVTLLPS